MGSLNATGIRVTKGDVHFLVYVTYTLQLNPFNNSHWLMKTKLTLRMEDDVIGRAKAYAMQRGTSVSALVEDYFRLLTASASGRRWKGAGTTEEWQAGLHPRVQALLGSARGAGVTEDDYRAHLTRKHR